MAGTRDIDKTNSTPSPCLAKDLRRPFLDFPIEPDLQSEAAELMVTLDEDAIETAGPGVLFYLSSPDLAALRAQRLANGVDAGEIWGRHPSPHQLMRSLTPTAMC